MKRPFFQRFIAATALIGAVLGTASVAQARPDVQVSIELPVPPGLPVFVPPPLPRPFMRAEPVYVQPRPVYEAAPVVVYERPWHPSYRHAGWPRYVDDRDHDGVPNRYDRDRDGDGVPNRYDRHPDNPYRR